MTTEASRRARQRDYAATYRENKKDKRSPERRDVDAVIGAMVLEGTSRDAAPKLQARVVARLTRAGFDRHQSEMEFSRLLANAAERASNAEIRARKHF